MLYFRVCVWVVYRCRRLTITIQRLEVGLTDTNPDPQSVLISQRAGRGSRGLDPQNTKFVLRPNRKGLRSPDPQFTIQVSDPIENRGDRPKKTRDQSSIDPQRGGVF